MFCKIQMCLFHNVQFYFFCKQQFFQFSCYKLYSFTCFANYSFSRVAEYINSHFANYGLASFTKYSFACFANYSFSPFANYSSSRLTKFRFFLFGKLQFILILKLQFRFNFHKIKFSCVTNTVRLFDISQFYSFPKLHVCLFPQFQFFLVLQNTVLFVSLNTNLKQNKSIIKSFIVKIPQACCKCMGHFLNAETSKMHLRWKNFECTSVVLPDYRVFKRCALF